MGQTAGLLRPNSLHHPQPPSRSHRRRKMPLRPSGQPWRAVHASAPHPPRQIPSPLSCTRPLRSSSEDCLKLERTGDKEAILDEGADRLLTKEERGMSSCLSSSRFQWTSSAGERRWRAAGESAGSRSVHSTKGRKKTQSRSLLTRVQLPRHFISIVCIVLFVLWSARSSLPCGISVLSHTQPPVSPLPPTQVWWPLSPAHLHSAQLPAPPVDSTRPPSPGRRTAALRELSFQMRSSH